MLRVMNLPLIWQVPLPENEHFLTSFIGPSLMMMMMMMNCFCGMVDRRKAFSLISSRDHCQRSSPSQISNTPRVGFEHARNLSSGLVEWSCAVVITSTPRRHKNENFLASPWFQQFFRSPISIKFYVHMQVSPDPS